MNITDRLTKLLYIKELGLILAPDIRGRLHLFDTDLNLIKSSPSTEYTRMINAITYDNNYIFTKDLNGTIGKWDLVSLKPIDFHDTYSLRDKNLLESIDEEPSPSLSRGIGALNDKLYTNNGYGQFVIIDQKSFNVIDILPKFNENSFIDCINVENEQVQAMSETCGVIHICDLENLKFDQNISIDSGNVHIIRYDKRHKRLIATQDYGLNEEKNIQNGIVTIDLNTLRKKEYPFTNDDVEFLQFDEDYKHIYTGGFDACIYVFDNSEKNLKLTDVLGPFRHQIISAVYEEGNIYVLMQSGELVKTDTKGKILKEASYDYSSVWALEHHPSDNSIIYSASGYKVDIFKYCSAPYNSVTFQKKSHNIHSFGIIFRICPLPDSSYIGLSRNNIVFRSDEQGNIDWYIRLEDLPKNIAVNSKYSRALVGLNNGKLYEIEIKSGGIVTALNYNSPIYVTGYTSEDKKIVGEKTGKIYVYNNEFKKNIEFQLNGYPKRFIRMSEKYYIVGSFGLVEIDFNTGTVEKIFTELLWNTKENGIILNDYAFVISYGKQIGVYNYSTGEMVDLVEDLYDFPVAITGKIDQGDPIILVGGNGGFINAYRIVDGAPIKVREYHL